MLPLQSENAEIPWSYMHNNGRAIKHNATMVCVVNGSVYCFMEYKHMHVYAI